MKEANSKDKYAAQKKYIAEQREYCNINLKKGTKAKWREYAAKRGLSLSKYIAKLIEADNS